MRLRATTAILVPLVLRCVLIAPMCLAQTQDQQGQSTQPPPNAQPQTIQPETTPVPRAQEPASQENTPSTSTPPSPSPSAQKPKTLRRKKRVATKPQTAGQSGKVIVRNGGAREDESQLSPGVSKEEALHQRETTAQLLATTDANLKRVAGRQLTPTQQSALDQINTYVRQAKAAADSGDVARAHTLAFKAHLLSDELARK